MRGRKSAQAAIDAARMRAREYSSNPDAWLRTCDDTKAVVESFQRTLDTLRKELNNGGNLRGIWSSLDSPQQVAFKAGLYMIEQSDEKPDKELVLEIYRAIGESPPDRVWLPEIAPRRM